MKKHNKKILEKKTLKSKNITKKTLKLIKLINRKTKMGGASKKTLLEDAQAIFELKTNLTLLPKAIEQNINNIENGINGAYLKKDKKKKNYLKQI